MSCYPKLSIHLLCEFLEIQELFGVAGSSIIFVLVNLKNVSNNIILLLKISYVFRILGAFS
jgi:hypothetical protein